MNRWTVGEKLFVAMGCVIAPAASIAIIGSMAAAEFSVSRFLIGFLSIFMLAACMYATSLIRRLSNELRRLGREMKSSAEQVASAASQVSSASHSLAQGASEQAASLEETSASGEEITAMTQKSAQSSEEAAHLVGAMDGRIRQANTALSEMVQSMQSINESSDKIAHIIKIIDAIAFQTNILALNAAVEAARAGQAGLGFAVVADEVRNLAQRSAQAARDTSELIQESISRSAEGKDKLCQVTAAIGAINESAEKVRTLVDEVAAGSREQNRGIEQIAKSIGQIEKVTQAVAANAEESASSSEELSAMADTMRKSAGELQDMVGGERRVRNKVADRSRTVAAPRVSEPRPSGNGYRNLNARKLTSSNLSALSRATGKSAGIPRAHAEAALPLGGDFREF